MPFSIVSITRASVLATLTYGTLTVTNPAYAADSVIVLNSGEAQLTLVDEATRKVIGTEPTGKEPHHLMITPDGRSLIIRWCGSLPVGSVPMTLQIGRAH